MKIALVQCPAWIIGTPPYSLALLGGVLKRESHEVRCYDFNIALYNYLIKTEVKGTTITDNSWDNYKIEKDFTDEQNIEDLFIKYNHIFETLDKDIISFLPDIICFTVQSPSFIFSKKLTKYFKELFDHVQIFWGGPYCFISYENIYHIIEELPEVDVVCFGDGEKDLPKIISDFELNGLFTPVDGYYFRDYKYKDYSFISKLPETNINDIKFADYSLFEKEHYKWDKLPVIASRGCVNRCSFCNEWTCWKRYQFRSPEKIFEEILFQKEQNPQMKKFWLSCSNLSGCQVSQGCL